jgi:methylamine--corrinoid protein Co-methyltransferase
MAVVDFMEVIRRTETGPFIEERDFDIEVIFKTIRGLVEKYGIEYSRDKLITADPEMADAAFQAGLELAEEAGIFCVDTSRQIQFSREELLYGLKAAPRELRIGSGKDQRVLRASVYGQTCRPFIWAGFSGAPMTEQTFRQTIRSYIKEPLVDALGHGSLHVVDGIGVRTGSPLEVRATRQELMYVREALWREGRPGMPYVAAESSTTALGDLATMHPDFMPAGNFHFVPTLNELKVDYQRLTKTMAAYEYGIYNINLVDAIIGGYAGGPEGAAVVTIAAFILGLIVHRASVSLCHPAHNKWVSTSPPESIWAENLVGQAFARNSPIITIGDVWTSAGTGTKDILNEITAITITKSLTGNHPHGVGATNGKFSHGSGLDARCMAEVAHAVYNRGLSLEEGNEIVCELVGRYEDKFSDPDIGKPYHEVYDVESALPREWWLEIYRDFKGEMRREFGLQL